MTILFYTALVVAGYVSSIYTWPLIRQALLGVQAEAQSLRAKAKALEAKL